MLVLLHHVAHNLPCGGPPRGCTFLPSEAIFSDRFSPSAEELVPLNSIMLRVDLIYRDTAGSSGIQRNVGRVVARTNAFEGNVSVPGDTN